MAKCCKCAGFSQQAEGERQPPDLTAETADDAIDLLMLHISQQQGSEGKGNCLPEHFHNQDSNKPLRHAKHVPTSLADAGAAVDKMLILDADSSAALYQWLDDLLSLLFQHPAFSLSVLTVLLLNNLETDKMLQVQVLAASLKGCTAYLEKLMLVFNRAH